MPDVVIQRVATRLNLILALLCGLPVLTAVVLTVVWCWHAVEVHRELENIRAQGLPTSPAEINDYYRIAPGTVDATALWVAAFKNLEAAAPADKLKDFPFVFNPTLLWTDTPDSTARLPQARQLIEGLDLEMKAVRVAAVAGGVGRFPVDYSAGDDAQLSHIHCAWTAVNLLRVDVELALRAQDQARATQNLRQMFAVSHALSSEPTVLSHLMRILTFAAAADAIADAMQPEVWADDQLSALQETVGRPDFRSELRHTLLGERALHLGKIQSEDIYPTQHLNLKLYLKQFESLLAGTGAEWPDPLVRNDELAAQLESRTQGLARLTSSSAAEFIPQLSRYVEYVAEVEARRRVLAILLAVQRYRLRYLRWPESLVEIDSDLFGTSWLPDTDALDPFTGQQLIWRLSETSFRIYSVGINRKDDRGLRQIQSLSSPDVGYTLKR